MRRGIYLLLLSCAISGGAWAQNNWIELILTGKVTLQDGSPPGKNVPIELNCSDKDGGSIVVTTSRKGDYVWRMQSDPMEMKRCTIRGFLIGYSSTEVDISGWNGFHDPHVPTIVITPKGPGGPLEIRSDVSVPAGSIHAWNSAIKLSQASNWREAERELRTVVKTSPKFAQGWKALGVVCENEHKDGDARDAFQHAIDADPEMLNAYSPLARADIAVKDWEGAAKTADALIKRDPKSRYSDIFLYQSMARYELHDLEGAETSAREAIRLDKRQLLSKAEFILSVVLEAKHDYPGAVEHLTRYLEQNPRASDAAALRAHIPEIGKPGTAVLKVQTEMAAVDLSFAPVGETWIPGGMKALASVAHIDGKLSYQNFFHEYCRAVMREISTGTSKGYPQFIPMLKAYLAAVSDLESLGEHREGGTLVTIGLATESQRADAERILPLLGWKLTGQNGAWNVEPGDRAVDGLHQEIPAAFGIDELGMKAALESGKTFSFEIPSEEARLIGGESWVELLKGLPVPPGGLPAAFTIDWRLLKAYAGLGAMDPDTAAALVSGMGLRKLVTQYADVLALYSEGFAVVGGTVAVPGGAEAEPMWKKLTGADPHTPPAFFRALLEKQDGKLAAFYSAVSQGDEAHQRFLTKTSARLERFYTWYRDSDEFKNGLTRPAGTWRGSFVRDLPLDEAGNVHFPGGRKAWTASTASDEETVLELKSAEALAPIALLEQKRKASLDEDSARLLAQHYSEWRSLFPSFERLPGLGASEFAALASFADAVTKESPQKQNLVLGEWHSLFELMARGAEAGSLDAAATARNFRRICTDLQGADYSAKAWAALRDMSDPSTDPRQAVPDKLLRLSGARRAAFDRVLELQGVPRIEGSAGAPNPEQTVAALSGFVYAASLDPDGLLVTEDQKLLSKHQFLAPAPNEKHAPVFSAAALVGSIDPPGSYISGGFVNFDKVARGLANGGKIANPLAAAAHAAPEVAGSGPTEADSGPADVVFRTNSSLVEAYATVTDSRGRYVDDLTLNQFRILEQGSPRDIQGFENRSSPVSVALLLDTTGSMSAALPALKSAAFKLIQELRGGDSVAVYSFNKSVTELQAFTTDKDAAKRAVLTTTPFGETALYDALARVSRDLSGRTGKKVIVLFTDGDDNSSTLTTDLAILRAKAVGVPVFTIAQGEALAHQEYLKRLAEVSKTTGGASFVIREPNEIAAVFEKVSEDLMHGYMLTFQAPSTQDHSLHSIEVVLPGLKGHKVRARDGYYPQ